MYERAYIITTRIGPGRDPVETDVHDLEYHFDNLNLGVDEYEIIQLEIYGSEIWVDFNYPYYDEFGPDEDEDDEDYDPWGALTDEQVIGTVVNLPIFLRDLLTDDVVFDFMTLTKEDFFQLFLARSVNSVWVPSESGPGGDWYFPDLLQYAASVNLEQIPGYERIACVQGLDLDDDVAYNENFIHDVRKRLYDAILAQEPEDCQAIFEQADKVKKAHERLASDMAHKWEDVLF